MCCWRILSLPHPGSNVSRSEPPPPPPPPLPQDLQGTVTGRPLRSLAKWALQNIRQQLFSRRYQARPLLTTRIDYDLSSYNLTTCVILLSMGMSKESKPCQHREAPWPARVGTVPRGGGLASGTACHRHSASLAHSPATLWQLMGGHFSADAMSLPLQRGANGLRDLLEARQVGGPFWRHMGGHMECDFAPG